MANPQHRFVLASTVAFVLALTGSGAAQAPGTQPRPVPTDGTRLFVMDSQNAGRTNETVTRFRLDPALAQAMRGNRSAAALVTNIRLSEAGADILAAAAAEADARLQTAAWEHFVLAAGLYGAAFTLADQLAELEGFRPLNTVMTHLGLVLTAWQVTMDLSRGDNRDAGTSAWRGSISFVLGRFGNRLMQVGGVSVWILDQTLQHAGQTAWAAREDHWRQAYARYYREGEEAARQAEFGVQPILPPTPEEHLRRINQQSRGGRSVKDWTILAWHHYSTTSDPAGFEARINAELDSYLGWFWSDPMMETWLDETGRARLAQGASLTGAIRTAIEAEHRAALMERLQRDVWPEIAARAWLLDMQDEVTRLNRDAIPELNAPIEIVVTAFGLDAPATMVMPRPAGGEWRAMVQPGQSRTLRLTRMAYLRAGMPNQLRLEQAEGAETQSFSVAQSGRTTVVFGAPAAQNIVALAVTEGPQSCDLARIHPDGRVEHQSLTRPARSPWSLHAGTVPGAQPVSIVGQYRPGQGWAEAAMSTPGTSLQALSAADGLPAGEPSTAIFTEPRLDALAEVSCSLDLSTLQSPEGFARYAATMGASLPMQCTFLREVISLHDGIELREQCRSGGEMRLESVLVPLPDGEQFMDMRQMIQQAGGEAGAGQILQGLEGMQSLQGLQGLVPRP
jgi:hypothetical protein